MKLVNAGGDLFVPDGATASAALARTTHMAIVAHQDDAEIVAYRGILDCFGSAERWFTAVVVTDGAGSSRTGPYELCTDEDMVQIRKHEQRKAAVVGDYSAVVQLGYTSVQAKVTGGGPLVGELADLVRAADPDVLFTHNLADRHDTHVAVVPTAGGPVRQVTSDRGQSWGHGWSPAGDRIAFAGQRDGIWNIWWVALRDGSEKRVTGYTKPNTYVRYPAWSPRGDQIVYEYAQTTGNVWTMDLPQ